MNVWLCFVVALAAVQAQDDSKIVNIKQGPVKGYRTPGFDVFAYYDIPYATAPSGVDKFKAPLPPPTWQEPFEAVNRDIYCQQYDIFNKTKELHEDCLVASIFAPDTDAKNLPVLVIIHGGGFQILSGNDETPNQLVHHNKSIIGVTFNYRLGPVGFLCLGTPDIPGNAGMRDQLAALKWVKDNIAAFGGNPDDITIAGCSAGGASVDLHMLSKASNGIFKRVIGQSGANIGSFAVQVDPTENARFLAKQINYDGPDNIEAINEFYLNVPYEQLLSYSLNENKDVAVKMSPCIERDLGFERFLEDSPINIIKKGNYVRYPVLYGWAGMEGIYRLDHFEDWSEHMNENFAQFLPSDLKFESEEHKQEVAKKVKEFYFGDADVSGENIIDFINYNSDVMFVVAMQRAITMQTEAGNNAMYVSVFTYTDNSTRIIPYTDLRGATHCTQFKVVFDLDESKYSQEYIDLRATMREIWLNFIHTSNPTPEGKIPPSVPKWLPAAANRTPCMNIDKGFRYLPGGYAEDRQKFWDELYDLYKREPVAPYNF